MKILISEKISQNRYKTPEGFLVCLNCILARTGKQTYTKSEVFGGDDETEIEIDRTAKEVFSPETLASFENKPFTIQHPDEDVNVDNYAEYAKGFIRNIRKGAVDGQEVMIGDIVVTDKEAIEKIENGELLDLSCGYDCDIQDEEHPQQRNIRGNHVALCEQGRAGCARIADSIKDDLIESASEEAFKKNIAAEIKAGKSVEQAVAIAYSIQRKHQQDNQEEAEKVIQKANEDFEEYMTDSMETYKIRWIDTYAKAKGYSRDMWNYSFETKANSVREALQKLADKVALGGTGTANALIVSIHSDTTSYMYSGKLSELLRTVADSVEDSSKTYEVKSKDEKGNTIVRYVKANSFIDAVKQKDATDIRIWRKRLLKV